MIYLCCAKEKLPCVELYTQKDENEIGSIVHGNIPKNALKDALSYLKFGDILVCYDPSDLGRGAKGIIKIIDHLLDIGVCLHFARLKRKLRGGETCRMDQLAGAFADIVCYSEPKAEVAKTEDCYAADNHRIAEVYDVSGARDACERTKAKDLRRVAAATA